MQRPDAPPPDLPGAPPAMPGAPPAEPPRAPPSMRTAFASVLPTRRIDAALKSPLAKRRLLDLAMCSDVLLLRTPFFLSYALGVFSFSVSWMFVVVELGNAIFRTSRARREVPTVVSIRITSEGVIGVTDKSTLAGKVQYFLDNFFHVGVVMMLCYLIGALGLDVSFTGLLCEALIAAEQNHKKIIARYLAEKKPVQGVEEAGKESKVSFAEGAKEAGAGAGARGQKAGGGGGAEKKTGGKEAKAPDTRSEDEKLEAALSRGETSKLNAENEWMNTLLASFWELYVPWVNAYVSAQLEYWTTELGVKVERCDFGNVPICLKKVMGGQRGPYRVTEGEEAHDDVELMYDLDLDIEWVSDVKIKIVYNKALPVVIDDLTLEGKLRVTLQWYDLDHRDFRMFPNLSFLTLQLQDPPAVNLGLKPFNIVDLMRLPFLPWANNYGMEWLYGFMGPPADFPIINEREWSRKYTERMRSGVPEAAGLEDSTTADDLQIVIDVMRAENIDDLYKKARDTYVLVRYGIEQHLKDEDAKRAGLEYQTQIVTLPGETAVYDGPPFTFFTNSDNDVLQIFLMRSSNKQDKKLGSWHSTRGKIIRTCKLASNGPFKEQEVTLTAEDDADEGEDKTKDEAGKKKEGEKRRSKATVTMRLHLAVLDQPEYPLMKEGTSIRDEAMDAWRSPGLLIVVINKCDHLPGGDGAADPKNDVFVRIVSGARASLEPHYKGGVMQRMGKKSEEGELEGVTVQRTCVKKRTKRPRWGAEEGRFQIECTCPLADMVVWLQVFDRDEGGMIGGGINPLNQLNHDDMLGQVLLPLDELVTMEGKSAFFITEEGTSTYDLLDNHGVRIKCGTETSTVTAVCSFTPLISQDEGPGGDQGGVGRQLRVKILNIQIKKYPSSVDDKLASDGKRQVYVAVKLLDLEEFRTEHVLATEVPCWKSKNTTQFNLPGEETWTEVVRTKSQIMNDEILHFKVMLAQGASKCAMAHWKGSITTLRQKFAKRSGQECTLPLTHLTRVSAPGIPEIVGHITVGITYA